MAEIFVIGHVNPDMDSIASAVGYAWLLKERDGLETVAARAGALNRPSKNKQVGAEDIQRSWVGTRGTEGVDPGDRHRSPENTRRQASPVPLPSPGAQSPQGSECGSLAGDPDRSHTRRPAERG